MIFAISYFTILEETRKPGSGVAQPPATCSLCGYRVGIHVAISPNQIWITLTRLLATSVSSPVYE